MRAGACACVYVGMCVYICVCAHGCAHTHTGELQLRGATSPPTRAPEEMPRDPGFPDR